jgi:hypothetical protein
MDTKKTFSLEEARQVVSSPDVSWPRLVEASGVITNAPESGFDDLLRLLKHRGLPQEWAAIVLYKRTKRPCKDDGGKSFVTGIDDWTAYLKAEKFI